MANIIQGSQKECFSRGIEDFRPVYRGISRDSQPKSFQQSKWGNFSEKRFQDDFKIKKKNGFPRHYSVIHNKWCLAIRTTIHVELSWTLCGLDLAEMTLLRISPPKSLSALLPTMKLLELWFNSMSLTHIKVENHFWQHLVWVGCK